MNRPLTIVLLTTGLSLGITALTGAEPIDLQRRHTNANPVIAQLVLRHHTVTISSTPKGLRYAVGETTGEILHVALTDSELEEHYPRLAHMLRPAVARDNATLMMWAPRKGMP